MVNGRNEDNILMVFGQNIRKTREKKNMNVIELARRTNYDRNSLSRLEYGEQNISYKTAVKLARELNTSFPTLFSRNYILTEEFFEDDFLLLYIENIKRGLRARGIPQVKIYIETGIHESVISRILCGQNQNPTLMTLYQIGLIVAEGDLTTLFTRNSKSVKGEGK